MTRSTALSPLSPPRRPETGTLTMRWWQSRPPLCGVLRLRRSAEDDAVDVRLGATCEVREFPERVELDGGRVGSTRIVGDHFERGGGEFFGAIPAQAHLRARRRVFTASTYWTW